MIPVVTPEEMAAVDAAAPEPVEELIRRAGGAVARAAVALLGGTYGRRVVVVAGTGNNGADGRDAARRLRRRGVHVSVVDALDAPRRLPPADLVVDAAFGTGFRGEWQPPDPAGAPVLAVDIPSGVSGLTGEAAAALPAVRTVTFAALKPGLVLPPGADLAGRVEVADIGLDVSGARAWVVADGDVAAWLPPVPTESHKWRTGVFVVAGSPGMTGAATLACRGALRAGAGYVRLGVPGGDAGAGAPLEATSVGLPPAGFDADVLAGLDRFRALVVGPGLGRDVDVAAAVRRLVAAAPVPVLVDGDGLAALADADDGPGSVLRHRPAPTVLTPHAGEFARLTGAPPPPDRFRAARDLAAATGATVLLKGSTTVVAAPDGEVRCAVAGDARLATAGTGDVLSGLIGALLAMGLPAPDAAVAGAHLHGRAAHLGWRRGLVAGDLPDLVPAVLAQFGAPPDQELS